MPYLYYGKLETKYSRGITILLLFIFAFKISNLNKLFILNRKIILIFITNHKHIVGILYAVQTD